MFLSANVKEHATLSARARVDHGVGVETTGDHENRAADRGCVTRLVRLVFVCHSVSLNIAVSCFVGVFPKKRVRNPRLQNSV